MPDILSQNEVDALLAAVDEGDLEPSASPAASPGGSVSSRGSYETPVDVTIYDFKRPERVSSDQIRSMEMLHEQLARKLAASLASFLRTIIDVKMASVEQLTYQEFIMSLPNPTCFNLMSCAPLDGQMVLEINPSIVFPIIDKVLGGGASEVHIPEREMTSIEHRLIHRITEMVLEFLHEIWSSVMDINFQIGATESNPQLVQIVPPNEVVILVCFELRMGESSGMLNLCIPFPVIEPIMGSFSSINTWFSYRKSGTEERSFNNMQQGLQQAPLEAIAYIAETKISVEEFVNLKPGDIIQTKKSVDSPLLLTLNGKPKFLGTAGQYKSKKAMRVVSPAEINARI